MRRIKKITERRKMDPVLIGIILIFIGFIIVICGSFYNAINQNREGVSKEGDVNGRGDKVQTKVAFGGFIGPIPFGFGNDKTMIYVAIGISLFLLIIWILFWFRPAG